MHNLPRKPVRFIEHNSDLLKSQEVLSGGMPDKGTDYEADTTVPTGNIEPTYRVPMDRENGNVVFRRYPNGQLDIEYAKHTVVDIIHKVKDEQPLTEIEKVILGCLFPMMFAFVDSRLAESLIRVQLRLAPVECVVIQRAVAQHLATEMNWNSGLGGGSDPGINQVRS